MQIYSWNGEFLSKQAGHMLFQAVKDADGLIVLPVTEGHITDMRKIVHRGGPDLIKNLQRDYEENPAIYKLGFLAIASGKKVEGFFTNGYMKIGAETAAQRFQDAEDARSLRASQRIKSIAMDEWEAEFMLSVFENLRRVRPAIVIAESRHAIVLGKMFNVKIHSLTKHAPRASFKARKVMNHVKRLFPERMGVP